MTHPSGQATVPTHHVPEDVLVEYVAGTARAGAALTVACHLSLCADCRTGARLLEAVGGAWLAEDPDALAAAPAVPMEAGAMAGPLERALAQLDDAGSANALLMSERSPTAPPFLGPYGLPAPLLHALDEVSEARWRFLAPGVQAIDLRSVHDQSTARLVKLKPGLKIPLHDHDGAELTLIFRGALSDDVGTYGRGDLSFRLPGHRHVQRVASGEECIALQVNEGPLKPLTLKGRLLRLLIRD